MYPPIFQVCAADTDVTAILGTGPTRLYPAGEAPQSVDSPYGVFQTISGSPENYLSGRPDIDSVTVQVDIYGNTYESVILAYIAVRNSLELKAQIVRYSGPTKESETGRYRVSFDSDWWVRRE